MIITTSRKFYSQFRNGATFASNLTDFTTNLVGSSGERIKLIQTVQVDWYSGAINGDSFTFIAAGHIQRAFNNFLTDGFAIGDTFDYCTDLSGGGGAIITFSGTITSLSNDGLHVYYTVTSGTEPVVGTIATSKYIRGTTVLKCLLYNFGIIENSESDNYISKVTGQDQGYTFKDLTVSTSGANINGYKGYETGSITCSTGTVTGYYQTFTITHTFTIPFFNPTFETNYANTTIPTDYAGSNSLKYIHKAEFRAVYSNPNGGKVGVDSINLGSVAFFNENFNGLASLYTFVSVVYTDSLSNVIAGIQKSGVTHVVAIIDGTISATHNFGIYISKSNEVTIGDLTKTFDTNYVFECVTGTVDDASVAGVTIKNYTCTNNTTSVTFDFDIEYSTGQQAEILEGDTFLIGLQIGQGTASNAVSDKTTFMLGSLYGSYIVNSDISGLLRWRDNRYYSHLMIFPDAHVEAHARHDYKGWIEDGILNNFNFDLDLSLGALLNSLKVEFIAYNNVTSSYWVISRYDFNTAYGVNAPIGAYDAYQIHIQTKRDFFLPIGDQFNLVQLSSGATLRNTSFLNYNAVVPFKIDWQKWIKNPDVAAAFYNNAELYNNFNQHSSNYYSGDWQLKFLYTAGIASTVNSTSIITNYEFLSPRIIIKDYTIDQYTPPKWVGVLTTWDKTGTQNLNGQVLTNGFTLFKTVWTFNTATYGAMGDEYLDFVCIHRIEPHYAGGSNDIEEFSSLRANVRNKLQPISGSQLLKITAGTSTITSECLIYHDRLKKGQNYKLSSRLFANSTLLGLSWEDITTNWEDINIDWQIL